MAKKPENKYENNPFTIGLNGLRLLFANAKSVAIYAIVLSVIALIFNGITNTVDIVTTFNKSEAELKALDAQNLQAARDFFAMDIGQLAIAGVLIASAVFLFIVVWLLLYGTLEYTAARLAQNKVVSLKEAFNEVAGDLAGYIWLYILMAVKIFLWSLLFIIPGIIMAVRYSLAGTAFFAEGKRGNAAIKRSLELTKGAWFTTFAGFGLWNMITLNTITPLLTPGVAAVLYRQLRDVTDAKQEKPAPHWLSWLTFFIPIALMLLVVLLFIVLIIILAAAFSAAP